MSDECFGLAELYELRQKCSRHTEPSVCSNGWLSAYTSPKRPSEAARESGEYIAGVGISMRYRVWLWDQIWDEALEFTEDRKLVCR